MVFQDKMLDFYKGDWMGGNPLRIDKTNVYRIFDECKHFVDYWLRRFTMLTVFLLQTKQLRTKKM